MEIDNSEKAEQKLSAPALDIAHPARTPGEEIIHSKASSNTSRAGAVLASEQIADYGFPDREELLDDPQPLSEIEKDTQGIFQLLKEDKVDEAFKLAERYTNQPTQLVDLRGKVRELIDSDQQLCKKYDVWSYEQNHHLKISKLPEPTADDEYVAKQLTEVIHSGKFDLTAINNLLSPYRNHPAKFAYIGWTAYHASPNTDTYAVTVAAAHNPDNGILTHCDLDVLVVDSSKQREYVFGSDGAYIRSIIRLH